MNYQDEFYLALGSLVRKARLSLNLTQKQLADLLHLNRTSITNIEKGKQKILAHTLVELAERLEIPVNELLPKKAGKLKTSAGNMLPENSSPLEREFLEMVLKQTKKGRKDNASKKKAHSKSS